MNTRGRMGNLYEGLRFLLLKSWLGDLRGGLGLGRGEEGKRKFFWRRHIRIDMARVEALGQGVPRTDPGHTLGLPSAWAMPTI